MATSAFHYFLEQDGNDDVFWGALPVKNMFLIRVVVDHY